MRQMEPIFIGDVVEYGDPIKVFSAENIHLAMVKSVDRKDLQITLSTGDTLGTLNFLRRIHCYDINTKAMVTQNGYFKASDDFDLCNYRPKENTLSMEEYKDQCKKILTGNKKTLERNLKTTGLPTDMLISEETG